MARGGQILAETVTLMEQSVRPGISTQDLDKIAEEFIRSHPGAVPSFKGLYNFPASICTSINNEIVHGIPSRKRVLIEGDIVSVDVGVKFEGYHTDSATTVAVGEIPEESRAAAGDHARGARRRRGGGAKRESSRRHRRGGAGDCREGGVQRCARPGRPRHRVWLSRGAASAELRQAQSRFETRARTDDRNRADGERRQGGH